MPANLAIVIERPDLYRITCNGKPVSWNGKDWWLDKAFGKLEIVDKAVVGDNRVTIQASPFTIYHELEPAYVLGNFLLKSAPKGFVITPDCPMTMPVQDKSLLHGISPDRTMWLSQGIGYQGAGDDRTPYLVFDLGENRDLAEMRIWNYNEAHVRDLRARGVKQFSVSVRSDSGDTYTPIGTFNLVSCTRGNQGTSLPGQGHESTVCPGSRSSPITRA